MILLGAVVAAYTGGRRRDVVFSGAGPTAAKKGVVRRLRLQGNPLSALNGWVLGLLPCGSPRVRPCPLVCTSAACNLTHILSAPKGP